MDFLDTVKHLITEPNKVGRYIKKGNSLRTFCYSTGALTFGYIMLGILLTLLFSFFSVSVPELFGSLLVFFLMLFGFFLLAVFMNVVLPAFYVLCARAFKVKLSYEYAFQTHNLAMIPYSLVSYIPLIAYVGVAYVIILSYFGFQSKTKCSPGEALGIFFLGAILFVMLFWGVLFTLFMLTVMLLGV